jgi:hypothetical protein
MKTNGFVVRILFLVVTYFASNTSLLAQNKVIWPSVTPDSTRKEILSSLRQYYADMSARKWKLYASHFWRGATLTTVWQPSGEKAPRVVVTTLDQFLAQTAQGPDSKPVFEERMLDADVRAQSNLAHVWCKYLMRFGNPGQVGEWKGIDAFTLIKFDGVWRIVSLSYLQID